MTTALKAVFGFFIGMEEILKKYLRKNNYSKFDIRAILFDMDGVLFDSMSAHVKSWQQTFQELGFKSTTPYEFYLHEGRVAKSTINIISQRELKRNATKEEIESMYVRKTDLFTKYDEGNVIPGATEILEDLKKNNIGIVLVTGSGQPSLLNRLDVSFPGIFNKENMVTAYNVSNDKPHPEPYLKGLQKGGNLKPNQAIVIENAPLGIEAASRAGIFTIAVNTGPLDNSILEDAGASIIFDSMESLRKELPEILRLFKTINFNNLLSL